MGATQVNYKTNIKTRIKSLLLRPAFFANTAFLYSDRLSYSCARGALATATRKLDPQVTTSWEFSAFSQNGEDGITDQLLGWIRNPNRYFVEIGASDGLENNTAYLAFVKRYNGLMIDADAFKSRYAHRFLGHLNWGVQYLTKLVTPRSCDTVVACSLYPDPDFLSLDIDGIDYYVAKALLERGDFRPKVVCVEYNSAFGPHEAFTVAYTPAFNRYAEHSSGLYYGVSIAAWKTLMSAHGYSFVTVDSNGVNAFVVDSGACDTAALGDLQHLPFQENYAQLQRFSGGWTEQFNFIRDQHLVRVGSETNE